MYFYWKFLGSILLIQAKITETHFSLVITARLLPALPAAWSPRFVHEKTRLLYETGRFAAESSAVSDHRYVDWLTIP
jgi:hypothetical protein